MDRKAPFISLIYPRTAEISVAHESALGINTFELDSLYSPDSDLGRSEVLSLQSPVQEPNKSYIFDIHGNHGTITGATWKRFPSGLWCLDFDGTNDFAALGAPASLSITEAITIEAWVNTGAALAGAVISKGWNHAYDLTTVGATLTGGLLLSDDSALTAATGNLSANTWYHVAFTYNKVSAIMYQNGALANSAAGTLSIKSDPTRVIDIGRLGGFAVGYLSGTVGEVRVYNRALNATEIRDHFLARRGAYLQ